MLWASQRRPRRLSPTTPAPRCGKRNIHHYDMQPGYRALGEHWKRVPALAGSSGSGCNIHVQSDEHRHSRRLTYGETSLATEGFKMCASPTRSGQMSRQPDARSTKKPYNMHMLKYKTYVNIKIINEKAKYRIRYMNIGL